MDHQWPLSDPSLWRTNTGPSCPPAHTLTTQSLAPRTDSTAFFCYKSLLAGFIWKKTPELPHGLKRPENYWGSIECGPVWARLQTIMTSIFPLHGHRASEVHQRWFKLAKQDKSVVKLAFDRVWRQERFWIDRPHWASGFHEHSKVYFYLIMTFINKIDIQRFHSKLRPFHKPDWFKLKIMVKKHKLSFTLTKKLNCYILSIF